jgi:hypothetical protein
MGTKCSRGIVCACEKQDLPDTYSATCDSDFRVPYVDEQQAMFLDGNWPHKSALGRDEFPLVVDKSAFQGGLYPSREVVNYRDHLVD